jgi:hypothetical protein
MNSKRSLPTTDVDRRQKLGRQIHDLWTNGGSDLSGLAPALIDGRIDTLCWMVMGNYLEDQPFQQDSCTSCTIDRVHCRDLSYSEFTLQYMATNRPVIILGLAERWKARQLWVKRDETTGLLVPDMELIGREFGNQRVPVMQQERRGFGATRPIARNMSVGDYVDWWNAFHSPDKRNDCHQNDIDDGTEPANPLLYLKDWKFTVSTPTYDAYEWPLYFRDDWLNQAMGNAYKFVYLGPKGTSTILHADVLRSFSWSTNLCGRKRWYLIPPEQTYFLYDCFGVSLATHLHADVQDGGSLMFPGLKIARRRAICVEQLAGETIFVPSCWYHTVENLEATLSINHNWLNGCNIGYCWSKLESEARSLHRAAGKSSVQVTGKSLHSNGESYHDGQQVDDDLILLWYVISNKFRSISNASSEDADDQTLSDLAAIQYISQGLEQLVHEGYAGSLAHRADCDISGLRKMVDKTLQLFTSSRK